MTIVVTMPMIAIVPARMRVLMIVESGIPLEVVMQAKLVVMQRSLVAQQRCVMRSCQRRDIRHVVAGKEIARQMVRLTAQIVRKIRIVLV